MITIDGWITIGTKLSTDKFDKQISDLENKIDSEEKKQELLNNKTKEYESALADATREVNNLSKEYDNATAKAEQLNSAMRNAPRGSFERMQLSSEYDEQTRKVDQLFASLSKAEKAQANLQNKVAQTNLQQQKSANLVDKIRGKIQQINFNRHNRELKEAEKSADNFRNKITNTIGQIGKMALAVFGVRSAYMALRQASSTLSQYNEQYATDLEYIRFSLTSGIAPILQKIVGLAQTLMGYINYLSKALFGKAIFGSAKDFEKMKNSAGAVAKSTKEIKNNLAGFDELNVLSSNQDTGGGGAGSLIPSMDVGEVEIPEWLVTLKDAIIDNFGYAFSTVIENASNFIKTLSDIIGGLWDFIKPAIDLIVNIFNGLWQSAKNAWDKWGKPIFDNFGTAIGNAGNVIQSMWGNFIKPVWDNIVQSIDWLWSNHLKPLWDNVLDFWGELINGILEIWNNTLSPFIQWIYENFGAYLTSIINNVINIISSVFAMVADVASGIVRSLKGIIEFLVGVFTGDWEKAWKGIEDFFGGIWDAIVGIAKGALNIIIDLVNGMITGLETGLNWIVDKINSLEITNPFTGDEIWSPNVPRFEFGRIPKLARGGLVSKPTQAVIGEAGREAVMPLDNNTEWMDLLADKLSDKISIGTGGLEMIIRFEGTMSQLVRVMKPYIEIENRRAGARIISGGAN